MEASRHELKADRRFGTGGRRLKRQKPSKKLNSISLMKRASGLIVESPQQLMAELTNLKPHITVVLKGRGLGLMGGA